MLGSGRRVALLDSWGEGGMRAGKRGEGRMDTWQCWRMGEGRMDTWR